MTKATLFSDPQLLPSANIQWREGEPVAQDFDDVYGSTDDAIAEKTHVFLQANDLPDRFAQLPHKHTFSVLELGFGSGLNFLLTWQLWRQQRQDKPLARLVYTSVEGIPMSAADLQHCQARWPSLAPLAEQLQRQYPLPMKGFYQLHFDEVTLNLILAPAEEALAQLQGAVDAVYMDGFNPAKNAAMWQPGVFQAIAQLSHSGTTLATYSAARMVKDNLTKVGYSYQVNSGFGLKRNQLNARFVAPKSDAQASLSPWQQAPQTLPPGSRIAVIGAGISGCSTALALQQRGYEVQLIEQGPEAAYGASGNQQGMLYAKLPDNVNIAGQLHQQGLAYSMVLLKQAVPSHLWQACGLLQLAQNEQQVEQMQRVTARQFAPQWLQTVSQQAASDIAADQVAAGGLWFAQAGWVNPHGWCQHLAGLLQQTPWFNTSLQQLNYQQGQWQLHLSGACAGMEAFAGVVLCNAAQAAALVPALDLPLKSIRGQVSYVQQPQGCQTVVCGEGYVTPVSAGTMAVGASYNLGSDNGAIDPQDHVDNLGRLKQLLPHTDRHADDVVGGRVGFRGTTPDYLPMVGQLADADLMLTRFAHLRKDKHFHFSESMPWLPGLYINAGHGSKGLITAPLCGQLLAAQMAGEMLPLSRFVAQALSPSRFFLRDMMRRKR